MALQTKPTTLGVIVGNRGFFPDHLCKTGREIVLQVLEEEGFGAVALGPEDTKFGSIESLADAEKCAALFKQHSGQIDGVLVTLPNFGDERAIANALRWAGLRRPVLDPGLPRRNREDDDRRSPRLVLRQDVGLQQPAPVRHQVQPDPSAHR